MAKHDNNAVIFLLCATIGICLVLMAFFLLRLLTVDAKIRHNQREVDKAIVLLREEREKLKAVQNTEKGKE